jgi:hypothetical protein
MRRLEIIAFGIAAVAFLAGYLPVLVFIQEVVIDKDFLVWLQLSHRSPSPLTFRFGGFLHFRFRGFNFPEDFEKLLDTCVT